PPLPVAALPAPVGTEPLELEVGSGLRAGEVRARGQPSLVLDAATPEDDADGVAEDLQVQERAEPLDVLLVQLHPRVPLDLVAAVDLRVAGQARRDGVPGELLSAEAAQVVGGQRARTDQG